MSENCGDYTIYLRLLMMLVKKKYYIYGKSPSVSFPSVDLASSRDSRLEAIKEKS